jgi:putative ABC transport system ATP-binding protein
MTERVVFAARGVTKVYGTGGLTVQALRGVDLDLYEGEFVVLLGASGSGKSTLLNILGGLDSVSAGEVRYEDEEITTWSQAQLTEFRRDHVGFVFQFYNLIPSLTARENVALVTDIAKDPMTPEEALRMVDALQFFEEHGEVCPAGWNRGDDGMKADAAGVAKYLKANAKKL